MTILMHMAADNVCRLHKHKFPTLGPHEVSCPLVLGYPVRKMSGGSESLRLSSYNDALMFARGTCALESRIAQKGPTRKVS